MKNNENKWNDYYELSFFARAFWVSIIIIFGLIISTNMYLYWVYYNCKFETIDLQKYSYFSRLFFHDDKLSIYVKCIWNTSLFFIFGLCHSVFATPTAHNILKRLIPSQAIRAFYLLITGCGLLNIMINWQTSDFYVWKINIINQNITNGVSFMIYHLVLLIVVYIIWMFDMLHFVGLKQLNRITKDVDRTESNPVLITTGLFSLVRHPLYFFMFLGYVFTPEMSFDRLWLSFVMMLNLYVAVPYEEKKLVVLFGQSYVTYQKTTPSFFPTINSIKTFFSNLKVN